MSIPHLNTSFVEGGLYVEANCSAYVGNDGAIQWDLIISDWLRYCWTVHAKGNVTEKDPDLLTGGTNTEDSIISYSNWTGPHIISKVKIKIPKGWKKSQLRCHVDSPFGLRVVRQRDKPKLSKHVPWFWGVGGTVACEPALKSAGTLLSWFRAPPSALRPDGGP
ncbi:hypothetical protein PoB_005575800 [Plakobranchus ocellatus]|uniref:Uncharacterized protein n=1 Tax=Plakobranchus ocellatus TaxID=259542 RepID=A0AAV4CCU2_9GAST|nr:hypothetical protein PoB_005575800 [Plakobranchus ocellatus]